MFMMPNSIDFSFLSGDESSHTHRNEVVPPAAVDVCTATQPCMLHQYVLSTYICVCKMTNVTRPSCTAWVQLGLAVRCCCPSLGFLVLAVLAGSLGPVSRPLGSGFSSGTGQTGFGKAWRGVTDLQQAAVAPMACVAVELAFLLDCHSVWVYSDPHWRR